MIVHIYMFHQCLFHRLMDPSNLKLMIGNMLHGVCGRISDYLDGDLSAAIKFPEFMKDLDKELEDEENSDWCSRRLLDKMKNFVPTGAGYLQGGLQRENWERCTLAIVRMASKTSILPGINYLIKHVGSIFRSLFQAALIDMTYQNSNTEQLMKNCPLLKTHLKNTFDSMVWDLMTNAAGNFHMSL